MEDFLNEEIDIVLNLQVPGHKYCIMELWKEKSASFSFVEKKH